MFPIADASSSRLNKPTVPALCVIEIMSVKSVPDYENTLGSEKICYHLLLFLLSEFITLHG